MLAAAEIRAYWRGGEAQVAQRREVGDDAHPADAAGEILEADGAGHAEIAVPGAGQQREAEVR